MIDFRNYKYVTEWVGKHTKWDYKLEIILPPTGFEYADTYYYYLHDPEVIDLPIGAVRLKSSKVQYKDYVIALPESPSMSIEVDFDMLDEVQFDALRNVFFEESPIVKCTATTDPPAIRSTYIATGILFNLYIKFNGCDNAVPVPYRLQRQVIYQSDGKVKLDAKKKQINIEAIDINRAITAAFQWAELEQYKAADIVDADYYADFEWDESGIDKFVLNGVLRNGGWKSNLQFTSYNDHNEVMTNTCQNIKRILTRNSEETFELTTYMPTFYAQLHDGTGDKGRALDRSELYLNSHVSELDDKNVWKLRDGLYFKDNAHSLYSRYPNGAWDYINELAEFGLHQYRVGPFGITSGFYNFCNIDIDLTKVKVNSFDRKSEQFKTVTSSCYEVRTDEKTTGDISKTEQTNPGGRNEASWVIPIVYNSTPPIVSTNEWSGNKNLRYYYKPKHLNVYYIDNGKVYRCHEWAKFQLAYEETGNKTSDDFNTFFSVPRTGGVYSLSKSDRIALACQTQSGIPLILSKTVLALLGNGLDKLEIEVPLNDEVSFIEGGGGNGFIWNFPDYYEANFQINIAEIFNITYDKNKWKMLASEIDYVSETAKVTLININI